MYACICECICRPILGGARGGACECVGRGEVFMIIGQVFKYITNDDCS